MSVSYEERLSSLVLKEEFFPLMDEMKESIGTLAAAGKGMCLFLLDYKSDLSKNRVYNSPCVSSFRAAGV